MRAKDKLKRDLKDAINEEVDMGLQGLKEISILASRNKQKKGPLSSRLRKRKLNSA